MKIAKNKEKILIMMLAVVLMVSSTSTAFASNINPGVKFGNWLLENLKGLFIALVAVFGVIVLIKRSLMQGLTLIIIAGIAALFIYGGDSIFQNLANLLGGFLK